MLFLPKNARFCKENADISKIKGVLVLKGVFSETTHVCVLTHQISSFNFTRPSTSKRTLKGPPRFELINIRKYEQKSSFSSKINQKVNMKVFYSIALLL